MMTGALKMHADRANLNGPAFPDALELAEKRGWIEFLRDGVMVKLTPKGLSVR